MSKKRWGEPTWYFFHTFIEKMTDDFFVKKNKECIEIITSICHNLPCPYCKDHASAYIKKHKIENIRTREQMKLFLFNFHNDVNKRTKKPVVGIEILEQYKKIKFTNAYKFFKQEFFKNYYNMRHFSGWIRDSLSKSIQTFIVNNIDHFRQ